MTLEKELKIINRLGLHARAAAKFVTTASNFQSELTVSKDGREVNGKSIMGVMMLAASQNTTIKLQAEGEDAEQMIAALEELINRFFDEGE